MSSVMTFSLHRITFHLIDQHIVLYVFLSFNVMSRLNLGYLVRGRMWQIMGLYIQPIAISVSVNVFYNEPMEFEFFISFLGDNFMWYDLFRVLVDIV